MEAGQVTETGVIAYTWKEARDGYYTPGRIYPIRAIILHSTDGHEAGDVAVLSGETDRKVSVHWYVTKDGRYYHFVSDADTAYHAGKVDDDKQHGNAATLGIEQEHIDGQEEWPDALVQATSRLVAALRQKHGISLPVLAHASVARPGGRKKDPKSFPWVNLHTYVEQAMKRTWSFKQK